MKLLNVQCLVTGGSRGIGLAIARRFAVEGASITLVARNQHALKESIKQLPMVDQTQSHNFVVLDIRHGWANNTQDVKFKDIVVNCAGVSQSSLLLSTDEQTVRDIIDINLLGTIFTTQAFMKPMLRQKRGQFVNISSVLASGGLKGTAVYAASKAGVVGFTKAIAEEMGSRNIRSNCFSLGLVETDMGRQVSSEIRNVLEKGGRGLSPDEVADEVLSLVLSDENGVVRNVRR